MKDKAKLTRDLKNIVGNKYVYTSKLNKEPFSKGWRYGNGEALAVIKPGTLVEMWHVIEVCVHDVQYDQAVYILLTLSVFRRKSPN